MRGAGRVLAVLLMPGAFAKTVARPNRLTTAGNVAAAQPTPGVFVKIAAPLNHLTTGNAIAAQIIQAVFAKNAERQKRR